MNTKIWYDGHNSYIKHTLTIQDNTIRHDVELLDVETEAFNTIHDIFKMHLIGRQTKVVEVLYSGGMDSECVLMSCIISRIPVRAITMRLMFRGYPLNTHDIYYSEKFCSKYGVEQVFIDLDVVTFFENGDYQSYLDPYYISIPHVATHFWLFEQCTGFPVLGGEYSWPWAHQNRISPHKLQYSSYNKFLIDRGIHGIGNMLNHSLESNTEFIRAHRKIFTNGHSGDDSDITLFKRELFNSMGFGKLEVRMKNYGWECVPQNIYSLKPYWLSLREKHGEIKDHITWNNKIASSFGGIPGTNELFK